MEMYVLILLKCAIVSQHLLSLIIICSDVEVDTMMTKLIKYYALVLYQNITNEISMDLVWPCARKDYTLE